MRAQQALVAVDSMMAVETRSVIDVDDMDTDPGHEDVGERPATEKAFASQRQDRDSVAAPFTQHEKRTLRKTAKQLMEFRYYVSSRDRRPNARAYAWFAPRHDAVQTCSARRRFCLQV